VAYRVGDTVYAKGDIVEEVLGQPPIQYAGNGDALLVLVHREGSSKYIVRKEGVPQVFCVAEEEIRAKPE